MPLGATVTIGPAGTTASNGGKIIFNGAANISTQYADNGASCRQTVSNQPASTASDAADDNSNRTCR